MPKLTGTASTNAISEVTSVPTIGASCAVLIFYRVPVGTEEEVEAIFEQNITAAPQRGQCSAEQRGQDQQRAKTQQQAEQ